MDMKQKGLAREAASPTQATPIVPPVDIIEDADGITVTADLPGVCRESLSIGVDGETLTLEGSVDLGEASRMQSVYAEIRTPKYRRSFVLGRDLDAEKIHATLVNGVLTLRLPKAEQAKPRRIEVKPA
jgi:HSP20 family protein